MIKLPSILDKHGRLCPACMIGKSYLKPIVYAQLVNDMLLTVPDRLALVCDLCGYHEFDEELLDWLDAISEQTSTVAAATSNTPSLAPSK